MKMLTFAYRNAKEILRDPLNLGFGLGFPIALLLLLFAIQRSIPVSLFEIDHLTPGISVFSLSFATLFCATVISKDRSSALLSRLYTSPMKPWDFIFGYTLPLLLLSLGQSAVCYLVALCLGLAPSVNILLALLFMLPASLLYVALGLLFGSILNDKQVGGVCGGLLTNLSGWLSGIWFDLALVGGTFQTIAYALPFVHAVDMERAALSGDFVGALSHLWWVLGYGAVVLALSLVLFLRQMRKN